ncbi:hypothetical protein Tco_0759268 [Tanacetum coccineum]
MDSIILLGQKNTLAEYMILSGADTQSTMPTVDENATNINLQGLPGDIYSLVNHYRVAKDLWERVQLLMQGTSLTKQAKATKVMQHWYKEKDMLLAEAQEAGQILDKENSLFHAGSRNSKRKA